MGLNQILKNLRDGKLNIEDARSKILHTLKHDRKELLMLAKEKLSDAKNTLMAPSELIDGIMQNKQSQKLLNSFLNESSGVFTNYGQRIAEPLLEWLDQVSESLSKTSSDDHEVLLKLSVLKNCDYENDCVLKDNQLLVSRWTDLHFLNSTKLEDNIFEASQIVKMEFKHSVMRNNHFQMSALNQCLSEDNTVLNNHVNLSVMNKTELIRCKFQESEVNGSLLHKDDFIDSNMKNLILNNTQIRKTRFENCDFSHVQFQKCVFHGCEFKNVKLAGTAAKPLTITTEEFYYGKVENASSWKEVLAQLKKAKPNHTSTKTASAPKASSPAKRKASKPVSKTTKASTTPKKKTTTKKTTTRKKAKS